jgi:hypothetical protein
MTSAVASAKGSSLPCPDDIRAAQAGHGKADEVANGNEFGGGLGQ